VAAWVAAMHYTGMAAMRVQAHLSYNVAIVASLGMAVMASIAALWLVFNTTHLWQGVASALVMGLDVCGMHYTGMGRRSCGPTLRCQPR
jgi:NO-binding membrane sensor protein with MHYT domain